MTSETYIADHLIPYLDGVLVGHVDANGGLIGSSAPGQRHRQE
jgi:hypothetical protein